MTKLISKIIIIKRHIAKKAFELKCVVSQSNFVEESNTVCVLWQPTGIIHYLTLAVNEAKSFIRVCKLERFQK